MLCKLFDELCKEWVEWLVELIQLVFGWCFWMCVEYLFYFECLNLEKLFKYLCVMFEILVIIVYWQLVICGDIEEICGVVVNINVIKMLEEWGWIDVVGYCDILG